MVYVIASNRIWYENLATRLTELTGKKFVQINKRDELTYERLKEIQPRYVFFPHWSYMVPIDIYKDFECVIFHMTDLPFGRGGSPLQNLITRGIYETKISALRCQAELDAGPLYMKRPLCLYGTAEEIYIRASKVIEEMVISIVTNEPASLNQEGEVVSFTRRRPEDGNIMTLAELEQVFDYIRMLDAEGYPKAFLETEHLRFEFHRPALKYGKVISDVIITKKQKG